MMLDDVQILDYTMFTPGQPPKRVTVWLSVHVCVWVLKDLVSLVQVPGINRSNELSQSLQTPATSAADRT